MQRENRYKINKMKLKIKTNKNFKKTGAAKSNLKAAVGFLNRAAHRGSLCVGHYSRCFT